MERLDKNLTSSAPECCWTDDRKGKKSLQIIPEFTFGDWTNTCY